MTPAGRLFLAAALLGAVAARAAAQSKDATRAAATITAPDVSRRVGIIADDSMLGRDTPSHGLDATAGYIASEFKRFGLVPGGDSGTYFQRYPLVLRRLQAERSFVQFSQLDEPGEIILPFTTSVKQWAGETRGTPIVGPMLLIGGRPEPDKLPGDSLLKGRFLVWVAAWDSVPRYANALVVKAMTAGALGFVVISNRDTATIAREAAQGAQTRVSRAGEPEAGGIPLVVEVSQAAVAAQFPPAQSTFDQMNASPTMVVQPLDDWEATVMAADTVLGTTSAPNVVGILPGTDPVLRNQYIVFSAHMDHIGISAGKPDSINNGADDDASGTVGVLELAEAFSRKKAATRRSLVFLTVSGEEKGLWGSAYFASHPPVAIDSVVANLNMDMIGRNWPDTIAVIGREYSSLGPAFDSVARAHPKLNMTPIADPWPEERIFFRSDHYNFAKAGVPILFFTSGLHADYHAPSDSPEKIGAEKEARLLQLIYWLGQDVGNAASKPTWNPGALEQVRQAE